MNFKQLKAFTEVMKTRSVSEAARRLHRTQPAISMLISGLENQLGLKLFKRRGMRLYPVPEAYYLLKQASHILDSLEQSKRTMKSIRNLEQGSLKIVCMPGPSVFFMPDLVDNFLTRRSKVKISLITKTSANIERLISAQQYDLGFADADYQKLEDSNLVEFQRTPIECYCALNHQDPLCEKSRINPHDLDGMPMAALHSEHTTRQEIEKAFEDSDTNFNVRFEAQYYIPLLTFVERGHASSIVDSVTIESYHLYRQENPLIKFRPFYPKIFLYTAILTPSHRPASRLTNEFIEMLKLRLDTASPQ